MNGIGYLDSSGIPQADYGAYMDFGKFSVTPDDYYIAVKLRATGGDADDYQGYFFKINPTTVQLGIRKKGQADIITKQLGGPFASSFDWTANYRLEASIHGQDFYLRLYQYYDDNAAEAYLIRTLVATMDGTLTAAGSAGFEMSSDPAGAAKLINWRLFYEDWETPAAPINLVALGSDNSVLLRWDDIPAMDSYQVLRSSDGVTYTLVGSPRVNFLADDSVTTGTNYFYRVRTRNNSMELSALCAAVAVTATNPTLGSGGGTGSGADQVTLTFELPGSVPIADASVWITMDAEGDDVVAGTLQTNSLGKATFMLDAGVTYYAWLRKDGVISILGQSFVAEAD